MAFGCLSLTRRSIHTTARHITTTGATAIILRASSATHQLTTSAITSSSTTTTTSCPSPRLAMSTRRPSSSSSSSPDKSEARPSASVMVLSPTNEVLLLHRVQTTSSFPSAHVFPGGNLDAFHDGAVPAADAADCHRDGPAYRLGVIRECFEESGILLARRADDDDDAGAMVDLPAAQRDAARKRIHANELSFGDFLASVGAVAHTDGLIPCTRWITPPNIPKRFTTQMYIYMLPISRSHVPSEMHVPTPDGGVEHTSAHFAAPSSFLARAASGSIILFPPQAFLLTLLARFLSPSSTAAATPALEEGPLHYLAQRRKLRAFLRRLPAADSPAGRDHWTAAIPWADKVISPHSLFVRAADGRAVLGLDQPGGELKDSGRGGDWERVVLAAFGKGGPRNVEIRRRQDVLDEEKKIKGGSEKL